MPGFFFAQSVAKILVNVHEKKRWDIIGQSVNIDFELQLVAANVASKLFVGPLVSNIEKV